MGTPLQLTGQQHAHSPATSHQQKLSILTDQDPNIMKRNNSKESNNIQNPVVFMRSICANHKHDQPVKKEHIDLENTGIVTRSKSNTAKYTDKENRCLCFTTFDEKSVLKGSTRAHRVRGDVNKRITCYNTAPVQRDFKQSVQSEEIYPLVQSHGTSYSLVQSRDLLYPMVQLHGNLYPLQASKRFKPSLNLDWKYRSLGLEYKEHYLHLDAEILYLSIRLLDNFLDKVKISVNKIQLAAITALWLTSKYDSEKTRVLKMTKLLRLCENVYSQKDMLYMEEKLLKSTNFQFNLGQPMVFVHYYLDTNAESTSEMVNTCNYLLDVLLLNSDFASATPSRLAAGAVYTAFYLNNKQNNYNNMNCTLFYKVQDIIQINTAMLSELDKDILKLGYGGGGKGFLKPPREWSYIVMRRGEEKNAIKSLMYNWDT
uniref:Cyclin-like domain-containing protein n=1 Tax=Timema genevievae TaxID=629358 RepID=A0A7R9PI17_TIMGE|nr:unnamed protein product [Timema genevievae]